MNRSHMENNLVSLAAPPARAAPTVRRPEPGQRVRDGFQGQRLTVLPPPVVARGAALPVVSDLYVTDIGHFPNAPQHFVDRPEGVPQAILIYATDGVGWCELQGREWAVTEGWALVVPPGAPHVYGADTERPWAIWWAHLGGLRLADYLQLLGTSPQQPLLYVPDVPRVIAAFEDAYSYVTHGYTEATLVGLSTSLVRILGLLKSHQRAPDVRARGGEEKVLRSIRYMREHLNEVHRLPHLARTAGLSVAHYSALFRKLTDMSPVRFLRHLKMQRACELLDTTDRPVAALAKEVGYRDALHFSRVFRQIVGRPPTVYRRSVKG
jgi:AraC family transcriptional regulator of arabinose operon